MVLFILQNNNFLFDSSLHHQLEGTGMGVDFAAEYACLSIGYLEEVFLFPRYLPLHFTNTECNMIQEIYDRYMDDGFLIWPKMLDIKRFIEALHKLHDKIKFTIDRGEIENDTQTINMLDVTVILHHSRKIETDIYYKPTNTHHYLHYHSHHPEHIKRNIPYNLAKRIIVFVSNSEKEEMRLAQLKDWLEDCYYPNDVIGKAFHNAKLQGPAPDPVSKNKVLPLVSTYCSNYTNTEVVKKANIMIQNCNNDAVKKVFENTKVVLAHKQPPNLLRRISRARFTTLSSCEVKNGLYSCKRSICKICRLYLQECKSFHTANNFLWTIKCHITCKSRNVIYFLKCLACEGKTSYTGKTNILRQRTNNHISACRSGNSTNIFDRHVFTCNKTKKIEEPFFELYAFMTVKNTHDLRTYEKFLHEKGYDTMNRLE